MDNYNPTDVPAALYSERERQIEEAIKELGDELDRTGFVSFGLILEDTDEQHTIEKTSTQTDSRSTEKA